jgi:hypothetical protein
MMSARPNQLEEHSNYPGVVAGSLIQVPVWILQSVAIGVGRQYPAPGLVYATCGTLVAALVWAGLRRADARLRRLMLAIAVSIVLAPLLLTLATYRDAGVLWQGRYGLPWGLGLVVLAGVALDRRGPQHPLPRPWLPVAVGAYGFGQAVCAISVRSFEKGESPSVALGLWHVPSPWLLGLLVLAGWAVLGAVLLVRRGALDGLEQPRLVAQPPALDVQA